ncbi:MAG: hypothetical protein ABSD61_04960 [Terracidiphilus sp.]|jgi:hypothetical protein
MPIEGTIHERETVRAFIQKPRQERALLLLSNPKRRREFTNELAHFKWLDERFIHPIPTGVQSIAETVAFLRSKGAGLTVWAIAERGEIDARELDLDFALSETWGSCHAAILSCIPGKLAYFRGEEMKSERLLIHP